MNFNFKKALPLFVTFLILAALIFTGYLLNANSGVDYTVLMLGNCLFFIISFFVFRLQYQAMYHKNPSVFIRTVMGSMLIKVFACVFAVVFYYLLSGKAFNKPAVYISMLLYVVYLVVEVSTIMKLNKSKNA